MLIGRQAQLGQIAAMLDSARAGQASVLRLVGGPGLGKTSLLDAAAAAASKSGMRVVRLVALEIEQEMHGAGLDLLIRALGARPASASALGLLEALEGASRDAPLLMCLDDVQWLDGQALTAVSFAARRLLAEPIAVLLAGRPESDRIPALVPFPRLEVPALSDDEGTALLQAIVPGMPTETARGVSRALAGVPLALHEVGSILPGDVLAGLAPLPEPVPVGEAIQDRYARGFSELGEQARHAVVMLAADTTGDPTVVFAALQRAGLGPGALSGAEAVGLVRLIPTPGFVHPLARAAVHAAAHPVEVRSANAALAAVLAEAGDRLGALRHRVACTVPPDAGLAGELTAAAESLGQDPGLRVEAAEAALQAARFTPDRVERARLQVVAAELGGSPRALRLVRALQDRPLPPDLRARCAFARMTHDDYDDPEQARAALVDLDLLPLDADLRHQLDDYLISQALQAADLKEVHRIATRMEAQCNSGGGWIQLMAAGSAFMFAGDNARAVPLVRRARDASADVDPRDLPVGLLTTWATVPGWLGEVDAEHADRFRQMDRILRSTGLPLAVAAAAFFSSERARREGLWSRAEALLHESIDVQAAAGQQGLGAQVRLACLTAYRGRGVETLELIQAARAPIGLWSPWLRVWLIQAQGALDLTMGRPEQAVRALGPVLGVPFVGRGARDSIAACLVDLVESLVAIGDRNAATAAADELARRMDGLVDPLAPALVARCRALVATSRTQSDQLFREAAGEHARTVEVFEAARTDLLHGEHLRRTRRPRDAREPLHRALATFDQLALGPWADRARRELEACGDRVGSHPSADRPALTAQETRVAIAVADGMTNTEVGQALFLSVKTVEFHLGGVYRKLGVRSRGGLAKALAQNGVR